MLAYHNIGIILLTLLFVESRTCAFQYRCLESEICLPDVYICDGIRHCPKGDDEKLCGFR